MEHRTLPCMVSGQCQKNFPKEFRDETAENMEGYPAYKRRNNGETEQVWNYHLANNHPEIVVTEAEVQEHEDYEIKQFLSYQFLSPEAIRHLT